MKKKNPMKSPESREKMKTTLRAIKHKPVVQGGNGKPPTVSEMLMSLALGWDCSVIVRTKEAKKALGMKMPNHYKVDVGNPILKVAIEIDGSSHCTIARKEQDARKEAVLKFLGWKVFRFSNEEVIQNLDHCVQMVLSIT
jgi:hypothetical protein